MVQLIKEEYYEQEMKTIVEPALAKARKEGKLTVNQKIELHYEWYERERAKGNLVIFHGYTESAEKYRELVYYFYEEGYQVFIADLRGHGFSTREVSPCDLTHIDRMDDYVQDLHIFVEKVVKRNGKRLPLYLFGHSMGGGISILYQMMYPGTFEKLVLSAPMIVPITGQVPHAAAKAIAWSLKRMGKGKTMMSGSSLYQTPQVFSPVGSDSEARWSYYTKKRDNTKQYQNYCPTYSWIYSACSVKKRALKKKNRDKIKEPVLLFQAGADNMVRNAEQDKFINGIRQGRLVRIENSSHEIYGNNNAVLGEFLETALAFLGEKPAL